MPNFKPKANKKIKINKKSVITLDSTHNEKINHFLDISNNKIPELYLLKKKLKKELSNTNEVESKLELQDQIKDIRKKIKSFKKKKKYYFLNNSKYIFEYFERKKNVSTGNSQKKKNLSTGNSKKKKILNSFF